MFDSLKERLEGIFSKLRGKGRLTEEDINDALREVRRALLEADVNYKIAKDLVERIKERCLGQEVLSSITPAQQVYAVVYEELCNLMGGKKERLNFAAKPPSVFMLVGLQGSGKTTTAVKLALKISDSHKPMVVACDLRRPAAVKQLKVLAEKARILFFGPEEAGSGNVMDVTRKALSYADAHLIDVIIFDTAGRLHIDDDLMTELEQMHKLLDPSEVLLVIDSMTGQEGVNVAEAFKEKAGITGVVLTKLDGDARGGAALAVKAATGVPIKLVGVGEHLEDLEEFDATRMAQRILGMGDMEGLLEKIQKSGDTKEIERVQKNLQDNKFTLDDLLVQLRQVQKLGPLDKVMDMLPLPGKVKSQVSDIDFRRIKHVEAVILSMTPEERKKPEIIKGSRKRRIASGSGTSVQMVNQVLKQYEQMKEIFKRFGKGKGKFKGLKLPKGLF
ncbi:signal recognition particle subunit FFH/SRP54 (srp54) [Acetomicrobium thermoterrenum DSM 13490]|uniref:Signal recognition particle protein n=1 Tax=Acetomicrobium thermoterrenum DSM 13490 TaxID=1120987 RepID=A0A1H3EC73_9BACT|nr:signal recognition particle protein [Acetomicrobium thermoterrenum]SDX76316.1 signal recognition particle subunit FFH/SRP54 (srp54) [Acetomicrobium thermoterrenum DSM 13490]